MKKTYILFLGITNFLLACSANTKYDVLKTYIQDTFHDVQLDNYEYIVVINELGECLNCNNSFSKGMSKYLSNERVLFLITSLGARVDISDYLHQKNKNILRDFNSKFNDLINVNHCAILKLNQQSIDTIIEVNNYNLNRSLLEIP